MGQFKHRGVESKTLFQDCVEVWGPFQEIVVGWLCRTGSHFLADMCLDIRIACKLIQDPLRNKSMVSDLCFSLGRFFTHCNHAAHSLVASLYERS